MITNFNLNFNNKFTIFSQSLLYFCQSSTSIDKMKCIICCCHVKFAQLPDHSEIDILCRYYPDMFNGLFSGILSTQCGVRKSDIHQRGFISCFRTRMLPDVKSMYFHSFIPTNKSKCEHTDLHRFTAPLLRSTTLYKTPPLHHLCLKPEGSVQEVHFTMLDELHRDLTTWVKWAGGVSDSLPVDKGVCQGGILSTLEYNQYINRAHEGGSECRVSTLNFM